MAIGGGSGPLDCHEKISHGKAWQALVSDFLDYLLILETDKIWVVVSNIFYFHPYVGHLGARFPI